MKMRKGYFCITDGDVDEEVFEGYTTGQHWNGWARPCFPESALPRLVKHFNHPPEVTARYDEATQTFYIYWQDYMDGVEDPVTPEQCETEDGIKLLWDFSMGLVWDDMVDYNHPVGKCECGIWVEPAIDNNTGHATCPECGAQVPVK